MTPVPVKYARIILVAREAGQPIDREIHAYADVAMEEDQVCAVAYGADGRPLEYVPTGEHALTLSLVWTDTEQRKRFEAFVKQYGAENVEILLPNAPQSQDKVDLHAVAQVG